MINNMPTLEENTRNLWYGLGKMHNHLCPIWATGQCFFCLVNAALEGKSSSTIHCTCFNKISISRTIRVFKWLPSPCILPLGLAALDLLEHENNF